MSGDLPQARAAALYALRQRSGECPTRGDVPDDLAHTMLALAIAATQLGATDDEVRDAMHNGFADADARERR